MRKLLSVSVLMSVLLGSCSSMAVRPASLTRAQLLEGAWVPERREFPVSNSVSPCQNFYEYACSSALSSFKLRDDRSIHVFSFSDSRERMLTARQNYLKYLSGSMPTSERGRAMKNFYDSCMNESASAREERELVRRELDAILSLKNHSELTRLLVERLDQPDESFFAASLTMPNQEKPLRRDVMILGNIMSLPEKTYYDKTELVQDLEQLYVELFKTLGLPEAAQRAHAVIELEKRFAQGYPIPAQVRERITQNKYVEREKLLKRYSNLQLERFLKRIPESTKLRDLIPEGLSFLNEAMVREPLPVLKDMLIAMSLPNTMDDAYPEFYAKSFQFKNKHLGGPQVRPVREERCARSVRSYFEREMDAELLPVLFPNFPEEKVVKLAEKVRSSLLNELKKNEWLSKKGKTAAIKKMATATLLVFKPGNDDEWDFNPPAEYSTDRPYENRRIIEKKRIEKKIAELGQDRNRRRWLMGPLETNAYYMAADNTFVLPAGILQYPFFEPGVPEEMNLAAIGSVIGHELGHGIDDKGSKYDEAGLLRQWMTDGDLKEFEKRGSAFIPRFQKLQHDGKLTMGENIGDHVGLTAAYAAAFGDRTASEQMKKDFFLQYARAWCYDARPTFKEMLRKTDPHASGEARVNEQVLHLPGFYDAFACKKGDAMYLSEGERIRIW